MNWYKIAQLKPQSKWVYHNTKKEFLPAIKTEGLSAGSFSDKPIDFGGDVWLAVERSILPERTQEHNYGKVRAIEPAWDDFVISSDLIYVSDKKGKIIGNLNELV